MFNIALEYPIQSEPRYGFGKPRHSKLQKLLNRNRNEYAEIIRQLPQHVITFRSIQMDFDPDQPYQPHWNNGFLPGLDIALLYHFVATSNSRTYLEIGSGNSTKVARRAIRDHGLQTRIISIDPQPRALIEEICDLTIKQPFESLTELDLVRELSAGDILFLDSSHRVFMNSDVTAFFLDVLPSLQPGVLVHIHDIFLPDDYPPEWIERYYSEQYLLACYLLAGSPIFEVVVPNHFIYTDDELRTGVTALWERVGIKGIEPHGGSFWIRIGQPLV